MKALISKSLEWQAHTIIGVLPPNFEFHSRKGAEVWSTVMVKDQT